MPLIIDNWFGRLGNNILQIIRCIHYAKTYNFAQIKFPSHDYLNTTTISVNNGSNQNTILDTFFNIKNMGINDPCPRLMKSYFQTYIKSIVKINLKEKQNSNILHIHIRSGDIFSQNGGHSYYVQPPLQYYKKIIKSKNWENIIIVYEDDKNPCVNVLKNLKIDNIQFQSSLLMNDIEQLCSSTNLAIGFGTFGYLIYLMNDNLQNLYIPSYILKELPQGKWGDITLNVIELPNYIKCGDWKNTEQQRNIMMNYR